MSGGKVNVFGPAFKELVKQYKGLCTDLKAAGRGETDHYEGKIQISTILNSRLGFAYDGFLENVYEKPCIHGHALGA